METLEWLAAERIGTFLDRRDAVRWSWCSRQLNVLVRQCCALRLTDQQIEVVRKVLALDAGQWAVAYGNRFPAAFTVSTGTSTGKTAISLACADRLVRRGERVLLLHDVRLQAQFVEEYRKFAERLDLLPLIVADKDWLERYQEHGGRCLVAAARLSRSIARRGWQQDLLRVGWDAVLCDDMVAVPMLLREGSARYGVCFNASGNGKIGAHQRDSALGELPSLDVCCFFLESERSSTTWDWTERTNNDRLVEEAKLKYREFAARWLALCGRGKTLVASNDMVVDTWYPLRPKSAAHLLKSAPKERLWVAKGSTAERRRRLVAEFQAASEGTLWASGNYISRGFNIPCDTLLVLDRDGSLSAKVLLQIVGRVRRVQTRHRAVRCCLVSSNARLWPLLAFLNLASTKVILQLAQQCLRVDDAEAIVNQWFDGPITHEANCISFQVPSK